MTQAKETMTWEELGQMKCRTCGGSKEKPVVHNNNAYDHVIGRPYLTPCPDCRDESGTPTGLAVPEITEWCDCECHIPSNLDHNCQCQGTGRTLKQGAELIIGGEQALGRVAGVFRHTYTHDGTENIYEVAVELEGGMIDDIIRISPVRQAALLQALNAAVGE